MEKRIKKKANKRLFGTTGVSIPTLASARDELYYELKNIWYGKAVWVLKYKRICDILKMPIKRFIKWT